MTRLHPTRRPGGHIRPLSTLSCLAMLLLAASVPRAHADAAADAGVVLITTVPARQGRLPDQVTGYGIAAQSADTVRTLSIQLDARIESLPVTLNQHVTAGQILAQLTPAPATVSAWQQAQSGLRLAQAQRRTVATLLRHHLATADQLDQADKAVADALAARNALAAEGAGQAHLALRAPFDGDITQIAVSAGDRVTAGAALMQIARTEGATILVGVAPATASQITPGMQAWLLPLEAGTRIAATVDQVGVGIDPKSRLTPVTLRARGRLAPNAAYRAQITTGQWQGWIVPHDAVLRADDGSHHLFQPEHGLAQQITVTVIGTTANPDATGLDVVLGPLDPHQPIIVDGAAQLQDGTPVRNADASGAE